MRRWFYSVVCIGIFAEQDGKFGLCIRLAWVITSATDLVVLVRLDFGQYFSCIQIVVVGDL